MQMIHLGHIWTVGRMDAESDKINYGNDPLGTFGPFAVWTLKLTKSIMEMIHLGHLVRGTYGPRK